MADTAPSNLMLERLIGLDPSLAAGLTLVDRPVGFQHLRPGDRYRHLLFPRGGLLSQRVRMRDARTAEINAIGRDGFVGLQGVLGVHRCPNLVEQQLPGPVALLPTGALRASREAHDEVATLLDCYTAFVVRSGQQSSACNALHDVRARAARWILTIADRSASEVLAVTQEALAQMLGTARQTVNQTTRRLDAEGVIEYRRGRLTVRDRARLQDIACECYGVVLRAYHELVHR